MTSYGQKREKTNKQTNKQTVYCVGSHYSERRLSTKCVLVQNLHIHTQILVHLQVNYKTNFHVQDFALGLDFSI